MLSKDEYQDLVAKCKNAVYAAVRNGKLEPITEDTKCADCGEPAVGYDHRNYYKPLEVEPVCRKCNRKRGPAYPYCEDWGKSRPGLEKHIPDDIAFDVPLAVDFDLQAYEDHEEYLYVVRRADEDVSRLEREMNRMQKQGLLAKQPDRKFINKQFVDGKIILFKLKWNGESQKQERVLDRTYYISNKPAEH